MQFHMSNIGITYKFQYKLFPYSEIPTVRMWHGKPDFPRRKSGFLRGGTRGVVVARVAGHSAIVP